MPAKYPPDVKEQSEPVEKDYYLFSSPCRSLAQIDKIQAEMPPGAFTPPPADWKYLPRTRRILTEGGELRLLAVGDSIVNDTMRSGWVAKLQEAYPKASIKATVYVRGAGGCQHYKEEEPGGRTTSSRGSRTWFSLAASARRTSPAFARSSTNCAPDCPRWKSCWPRGTFGTVDPRDAKALANAPHSGTGSLRPGAQGTRRRGTLRLPRHDHALGRIHPLVEAASASVLSRRGPCQRIRRANPRENHDGVLGSARALARPATGVVPGPEVRVHDALGALQPVGLHRVLAAGGGGQVGPAGRLEGLDRARQGHGPVHARLLGAAQDLQPGEVRSPEMGRRPPRRPA